MKWVKHESDASTGNKLTKLRMKHGATGLGIYWYCVELIAHNLGVDGDVSFELKHDADVIGFNLKLTEEEVDELLDYCVELRLFERVDSVITCKNIAKRLDKKVTRNKDIHKIIDAVSLSPTVLDTSGQTDTNADCPSLPTLELELELDKKTHSPKADASERFEKLWTEWPEGLGAKGNKKRAKSQFLSLNPSSEEFEAIMLGLMSHTRHKRESMKINEFVPNFQHVERWVRDRGWEDDIPCGQKKVEVFTV